MSVASRNDFTGAVEAGVIDAETAKRLTEFYRDAVTDPAPTDPDDERFRLITGFNDIFVTTGIALLFGSLLFFGSAGAFVVAVMATLFTLVAIIVDRRALIVSSLAYVGAALMMLINGNPRHDGSFIYIVMLIGAAVLALSVAGVPFASDCWRFFPLTPRKLVCRLRISKPADGHGAGNSVSVLPVSR